MLQLTRIPVDSSMLFSVAYDKETSTLYAEFNTGQVWGYANVSEEVFNGLLKASSVGSYMRYAVLGCYGDYQVRRGRDFKWQVHQDLRLGNSPRLD